MIGSEQERGTRAKQVASPPQRGSKPHKGEPLPLRGQHAPFSPRKSAGRKILKKGLEERGIFGLILALTGGFAGGGHSTKRGETLREGRTGNRDRQKISKEDYGGKFRLGTPGGGGSADGSKQSDKHIEAKEIPKCWKFAAGHRIPPEGFRRRLLRQNF